MSIEGEVNEVSNVLAEAKEKARKEAEKKLNKASLGQTGYMSGKEKNSLREQLGFKAPVTKLISNKVGRNAPCPCGAKNADGSTKKFKNCHGR